jgi:hypothetical protein
MEETIPASFQLLFMRQFFEYQKSGVPDFSLTNLKEKMPSRSGLPRICRRLEVFAALIPTATPCRAQHDHDEWKGRCRIILKSCGLSSV